MWDAHSISGPLITCVLVFIINVLFYWKIKKNFNKKKVLNDDETKEKQQESSIPKNKNPYFYPSNSDSDFEYEFTCEICSITFLGLKLLEQQNEKDVQSLKLVRKKEIKKKSEEDSVENGEDDLEQTLYAICKTCEKEFMGPESLELHLKSSNHKKKMAAYKLLKEIRDEDGCINLDKLRQKLKGKSKKAVPGKNSEFFSDSDSSESSDGNNGADGYSLLLKSSDETISETREIECLDCKKVFTVVNPWYQHLVSNIQNETLNTTELFSNPRNAGLLFSKEISTDQYLEHKVVNLIICSLCNVALSNEKSAKKHLKSKKHTKNLKRKKSTAEGSEEMEKYSEKKEKVYSESSFQKSSEVRSRIRDQGTKGIQKSTAEDREEMNKYSEKEEKVYSESSFQKYSEVRSRIHDQETNGIKIDLHDNFQQKFSMSVGHDRNKLVSEVNATPTVETNPYLKSSNATGDNFGSKKTTDQDVVSQNLVFKKSLVASTADKNEMPDNSFKDPIKKRVKSTKIKSDKIKPIFRFTGTLSTSQKLLPTKPQKSYIENYASKIFEDQDKEKIKQVDDSIHQNKTNLYFRRYASPSF